MVEEDHLYCLNSTLELKGNYTIFCLYLLLWFSKSFYKSKSGKIIRNVESYSRYIFLELHICRLWYGCKFLVCFFFIRPPERRHGYEQQFHSITAQSEHEALEAKRPRMETVAEAHITRTPPTAGGIVLPITHTVQDSLRATVEVKKVGPVPLFNLLYTE